MKYVAVVFLIVGLLGPAFAGDPKCSGPDNWAAAMAFVSLKNAGLTDNAKVDFSKTKVIKLASQLIGKDLYRQVHRVTFVEHSGRVIDVITVNDASHEECSMSGVEVFVVAKHFGP